MSAISKKKVFLSWSGKRSLAIAQAFNKWIPVVIQQARTYFTAEDINRGARWRDDIARELESSSRGLFFFTSTNTESSWMIFEAGALSKSVGDARVCPILFDIKETDLEGPLSQFQATSFDRKGILKLLSQINSELGDDAVEGSTLSTSFDLVWPDLETDVDHALSLEETDPDSDRTDRDLIQEVLSLVRSSTFQSYVRGSAPDQDAVRDLVFVFADLLHRLSTTSEPATFIEVITRMDPPIARLLVQCRFATTPWAEMTTALRTAVAGLDSNRRRLLDEGFSKGCRLFEDEAFGIPFDL